MVNSSSFNLDCLSKNKELLKMAISGIILLIVIIVIYNMYIRPNNNQEENRDTIIFYVADWCPHCQKLKSFIDKCKEQDMVNIDIVNVEDMSNEEKRQINGFPTAIRVSDDKMAVGEVEIKKLVNQTVAKGNVEYFDVSKNNTLSEVQFKDILTFYTADWCVHCDIMKDYIKDLQNRESETKIKINIVNFNNMSENEKILINGFPSVMRKSDNVISIGKIDIEKLVQDTLSPQTKEGFTTGNKSNNDTIQFYIAEWCGHSQKLLPYIDEYKKQQNVVNVEVINEKDIPRELNITGYPTAIRKSDNKRAVGGPEILNLMKETMEMSKKQEVKQEVKQQVKQEVKQQVKQVVDSNKNTIIVFLAEWCPHCQNFKPQLTEIMKTNKNIELVDSNNITPELQKHVQGFPTALRVSDETVAVGAPNILKLINSTSTDTNNNNNTKQENKSNYIFVYSNNCKYSNMIIPKWLEFKLYTTDNKLNVNLLEYESNELDNLPNNYKSQLVGFPTLFINDNEKYEGYDDIINYLNDFS
jgi:thiol-disulfide isomerase/thioredoxin